MLCGDDVLGFIIVYGEAGTLLAKLVSENVRYRVFADEILTDFDFHRQLVSQGDYTAHAKICISAETGSESAEFSGNMGTGQISNARQAIK